MTDQDSAGSIIKTLQRPDEGPTAREENEAKDYNLDEKSRTAAAMIDCGIESVRMELPGFSPIASDKSDGTPDCLHGFTKMNATGLPSYERPPVVETIFCFQFSPLPHFTNAHLGLFWQTLDRANWKAPVDAVPLMVRTESSDDSPWTVPSIIATFQSPVRGRMQVRNSANNRMIQLQNGGIWLNWIGTDGDSYPRYDRLRGEFRGLVEGFRDFALSEGLGTVELNGWELTYLNHIPQGTVWESLDDWTFFRPMQPPTGITDLTEPESCSGEWHFRIQSNLGRLHVNWQHALGADARQLVVLNFRAEGPATSQDVETALQGMDIGRETIVRTFSRLASDAANQYWGLRND